MQCSFVFSQSRVLDFLDAFDENESAVPGTISIFFFFFSFFFFFLYTHTHTLSLFLCCVVVVVVVTNSFFFRSEREDPSGRRRRFYEKTSVCSPRLLFLSFSFFALQKGADSGTRYLKAVHSVFPKNGIHKLRLTRALNKTFSFYHDF